MLEDVSDDRSLGGLSLSEYSERGKIVRGSIFQNIQALYSGS